MKKILFILLVVLFAGSATMAVADDVKPGQRRAQMLQQYVKKNPAAAVSEENFLNMVKEGDVDAISKVQDIALFQANDKFGNNCFHLAPDAATLQALAGVVRRLNPALLEETFSRLRNERNDMGETPLMAHVSYGKAETFFLLYRGSELEMNIRQVQAIDKGGALSSAASIRKGVVVALSKDMSGRTVAQAALANADKPNMSRVINFFRANAPYLF